jgi:beta-N-acetylhexosaminidase
MCFSNNIQGSEARTVDKVHVIIKQMVINGQISQQRINESFQRIKKLKGSLNNLEATAYKAEIERLQNELVKSNAALKSANEKTASATETKKSKRKKKSKS